ncbi:MAG: hypothetical protein ACXWGX_12370 [Usitatibacter sp.]
MELPIGGCMKDIGSGVADRLACWAAENPEIRRVWVFADRTQGASRRDGGIDVAVELEPVGDSGETLAVWMAHSDSWRAQLRSRLLAAVDLEWVDLDGSTRALQARPGEAKALVHERW